MRPPEVNRTILEELRGKIAPDGTFTLTGDQTEALFRWLSSLLAVLEAQERVLGRTLGEADGEAGAEH